MVIIFRKGNKKGLNNYRLLCLLSNIYKVLTKVLTKRLQKTLDETQPRELAGFTSGYSTTDHIHVVNQLKENCREYNIPLCIAFINLEKAFESVQTQSVLTSFQNQHQQLDDSPPTRRKQQDQHQERSTTGDTISPKLFMAALEIIFRRLT